MLIPMQIVAMSWSLQNKSAVNLIVLLHIYIISVHRILTFRDIKDRTVLRVHECDSKEPQRVMEKPEVRGRTIQIPASAAQGYYGTVPSSAVTSQVNVRFG